MGCSDFCRSRAIGSAERRAPQLETGPRPEPGWRRRIELRYQSLGGLAERQAAVNSRHRPTPAPDEAVAVTGLISRLRWSSVVRAS